jgi:hypothetical protein
MSQNSGQGMSMKRWLSFYLCYQDPDDDLRLQFEALSQFDENERMVAEELLESLILKHNAKRPFADKLA